MSASAPASAQRAVAALGRAGKAARVRVQKAARKAATASR